MSSITKERKMFRRNDENKVSVFNVISDETEKVRVRALSSSDYVARCLKSEKVRVRAFSVCRKMFC